jgi:plastocyanin
MKMRRTLCLIVILLLVLAGCRAPAPEDPSGEVDIIIEVSASNYEFSPDVIQVENGQTVRIVLTSTQGTHDWVVDEFSAATALVLAGNTRAVDFVADQTGEFEFYCSVENHRALGMVGTLTVVD